MTSKKEEPVIEPVTHRIEPVSIEQEMKVSFINYAMSVIISRAIPDVRDGLKPVHRRSLYGMWDMGNTSDKPTKKSARVVGDVMVSTTRTATPPSTIPSSRWPSPSVTATCWCRGRVTSVP